MLSSDLALTFTRPFLQFALKRQASSLPLGLVVRLNSGVPQHAGDRAWPRLLHKGARHGPEASGYRPPAPRAERTLASGRGPGSLWVRITTARRRKCTPRNVHAGRRRHTRVYGLVRQAHARATDCEESHGEPTGAENEARRSACGHHAPLPRPPFGLWWKQFPTLLPSISSEHTAVFSPHLKV